MAEVDYVVSKKTPRTRLRLAAFITTFSRGVWAFSYRACSLSSCNISFWNFPNEISGKLGYVKIHLLKKKTSDREMMHSRKILERFDALVFYLCL